jgi:hypothetical protein
LGPRRLVVALCAVGALALGVVAASADPRFWAVFPSPSPDTVSSLHGISLLNAREGWAVGLRGLSESGPFGALAERWDGASWSVVPISSVGDQSALSGVASIARDDAWAVGNSSAGGFSSALVEHWDGSSWSVVPGADVSGDQAFLTGVTAVDRNDVWAAGFLRGPAGGPVSKPVLEHWDGVQWNLVVPPAVGDTSLFFGIAAHSSDDVWAVGWSTTGGVRQPLTEHWDGTAWTVVASPYTPGAELSGVTARRDVWAVGDVQADATTFKTFAEHWDGDSWSIVFTPNPSFHSFFLGVDALSAHDVWAVGDTNLGKGGIVSPLIEHYDGHEWTVVASAPPRDDGGFLQAVDVLAPTKGFTVGATHTITPLGDATLVERLASH